MYGSQYSRYTWIIYINIYAYVRVLILYLINLCEPLPGLEDRAPWALLDFFPSQGSRARPITRLTRIPKMRWNGMDELKPSDVFLWNLTVLDPAAAQKLKQRGGAQPGTAAMVPEM